jgi:hypothetical protein
VDRFSIVFDTLSLRNIYWDMQTSIFPTKIDVMQRDGWSQVGQSVYFRLRDEVGDTVRRPVWFQIKSNLRYGGLRP